MANSKEKLISKKYADALAEVKLSQGIIDDLKLVQSSLETSEELKSTLSNPGIKIDLKRKIIKDIFESKISSETLNLLLLLLKKRRMNLATSLLEFYRENFYKKENIGLAELETARKLEENELNEIKQVLEKTFNKSIELSETINEDLLAGMRVRISNKIIDSSLKSKLKQMKTLLLK
jgi:F-type H+-transporting ATPase subunit delta